MLPDWAVKSEPACTSVVVVGRESASAFASVTATRPAVMLPLEEKAPRLVRGPVVE